MNKESQIKLLDEISGLIERGADRVAVRLLDSLEFGVCKKDNTEKIRRALFKNGDVLKVIEEVRQTISKNENDSNKEKVTQNVKS